MSDNSFSKTSIRSKVLKLLPWLERIDKGTVSYDERSHETLNEYEENVDDHNEEEEGK